LGFGLPITILTFFLKPPFVSLGLYSAFFPWPLALAPHSTAAASKEVGLASQYALPPLPLFAPSRRLCDNLLDRVMAFIESIHETSSNRDRLIKILAKSDNDFGIRFHY
jgi:hypothetical protein